MQLFRWKDLDMSNKHEVVKFENGDLVLDVDVSPEQETVWLSQRQMSELFGVSTDTIGLHIKNILRNKELDSSTTEESSVVQNEGGRKIRRMIKRYNLDMIISVGYRVNSKRGITFRRWATAVLKDYLVKGYAVNQKQLSRLNKTIEIQSKMLAAVIDSDSTEVLKVVNEYTKALSLLDDYDHQTIKKPKGNKKTITLSYEECRELIDHMGYGDSSRVFGVEKENGKLKGILVAINQTAFGKEVYPSVQEKAANLLYFLIKDHPFVDGCKRIGATLFLKYLDKNHILFTNHQKKISDNALVAITLMIAESNPKEKDVMVALVMNLLD